MSAQQPHPGSQHVPTPLPAPEPASGRGHGHGRGHMFTMLLMCAPMLLFVGVLVLTGRATGGSILGALLCVGMMAAMMGMHGGHDRR